MLYNFVLHGPACLILSEFLSNVWCLGSFFFCPGKSNCFGIIWWKSYLPSLKLLYTFVKKSIGHKCVDYLYWSLNLCVYSAYYYSFAVGLCIRTIPYTLFLFTLASIQPVPFHVNFRISLSVNFIKLVVQLWGRSDIFTVLNLPIHKLPFFVFFAFFH